MRQRATSTWRRGKRQEHAATPIQEHKGKVQLGQDALEETGLSAKEQATWLSSGLMQRAQKQQVASVISHSQGNNVLQALIADRKAPLVGPRGLAAYAHTGLIQREASDDEQATDAGDKREDYVFILGTDRKKSRNKFYTAATKHFQATLPGAIMVRDKRTLADVFDYLRQQRGPANSIYLVAHAAQDGTLSVPLKKGDKDRHTDYGELRASLEKNPELFSLTGQVDENTTIYIKGCNIGRSKKMVDLVDQAFGGLGKVIAPTHKQAYAWKRGQTYEFLKNYFIEMPGNVKLDRPGQLDEFMAKYPELDPKTWSKLLPKKGANRKMDKVTAYKFSGYLPGPKGAKAVANKHWFAKEPYKARKLISKQEAESGGNIEHSYLFETVSRKNRKETGTATYTISIPTKETLKAKAMEWAEANLGRPEAYEWRVESSKPGNPKVVMKVVGRRTEFNIAKPLREEKKPGQLGNYLEPATDEATYFGVSD